ncbi:unnamed protein product [Brassica rapa subsp. trilocularis]
MGLGRISNKVYVPNDIVMPTPTATSLARITKTSQARYASCNTHIGYGQIISMILAHTRCQ